MKRKYGENREAIDENTLFSLLATEGSGNVTGVLIERRSGNGDVEEAPYFHRRGEKQFGIELKSMFLKYCYCLSSVP